MYKPNAVAFDLWEQNVVNRKLHQPIKINQNRTGLIRVRWHKRRKLAITIE